MCHLVANCHLPIAISNGKWLRNVGNLACQLKWRNGYHRQFIERVTTIRQLSRQSGNSSSLKNSTRYWAGRDFICGLGRQQLCDEKQNIQVQKIFFKLHKRAGFFFSLSLVWMTLTQNQIDFECAIHQNSIIMGSSPL